MTLVHSYSRLAGRLPLVCTVSTVRPLSIFFARMYFAFFPFFVGSILMIFSNHGALIFGRHWAHSLTLDGLLPATIMAALVTEVMVSGGALYPASSEISFLARCSRSARTCSHTFFRKRMARAPMAVSIASVSVSSPAPMTPFWTSAKTAARISAALVMHSWYCGVMAACALPSVSAPIRPKGDPSPTVMGTSSASPASPFRDSSQKWIWGSSASCTCRAFASAST
mmetsp:Transcript_111925/g.194328  ORF Transcript_111925/g.194328 Transcript_111925/m.194328 type:complete len:226 (+) Transcript_111925:434-1111(+)